VSALLTRLFALLIAHAADATVGSALICSEAHTLPQPARIAVAASVRNRMKQTGWSAIKVMRYPRAYAPHLCPLRRLELAHLAAYVDGRLGRGPKWTRNVYAFYHRRRHVALREIWERRGLIELRVDQAHVYWRVE